MASLPHLIIILFSIAGLILSIHIFRKKREKKPMVCPLHANCEAVVFSQFSTFFGIPLEILGILYYTFTGLGYLIFIIQPETMLSTFVFLTLVATTFAFVFSIYLTFIQAFALRNWCTWCLTSAGFCTVIFIATIFSASVPIAIILADHLAVITTVKTIALALGAGSITTYSVLYLRFLKDLKISSLESEILKNISQITWLAIFLNILSVIGLYPNLTLLPNPEWLLLSLIVILVLVINEAILGLLVSPKLIDISFNKKDSHPDQNMHKLRQLSFIITIGSLVSWYFILISANLADVLPLSFDIMLGLYTGLLIIAFIFGLIADKFIHLNLETNH